MYKTHVTGKDAGKNDKTVENVEDNLHRDEMPIAGDLFSGMIVCPNVSCFGGFLDVSVLFGPKGGKKRKEPKYPTNVEDSGREPFRARCNRDG